MDCPTCPGSRVTEEPQQVQCRPVGGPLTQATRDAAKKLFKSVAGLLSGAYSAVECTKQETLCAAKEWVVVADGTSPMAAVFSALATTIIAGAVPVPGLTALLTLRAQLHQQDEMGAKVLDALASRLDWIADQLKSGSVPVPDLDTHFALQAALGSDGREEMGESFCRALAAMTCPQCQERPIAAVQCRKCDGAGHAACSRCHGTGRYAPVCRACDGAATRRSTCQRCEGRRKVDLGVCGYCSGQRSGDPCNVCLGGKPFCAQCILAATQARRQQRRVEEGRQPGPVVKQPSQQYHRLDEVPAEGVTVSRASASDMAWLERFWGEREASSRVVEAWSIDNPLLTYKFRERKRELERLLGRQPDQLEGLHGSSPENLLSIVQLGFRSDLRSGQVHGAGEYFAKNPNVSVKYCRKGDYMLVCSLCLGVESSNQENSDGDHIWVPTRQYYVICRPSQVLPRFIVKFSRGDDLRVGALRSEELEKVLSAGTWSTKKEEEIRAVPPNHPCFMSRPEATVLWMGLLHAHHSDEQLHADVCSFLTRHAPDYVAGMKVQVVRGLHKKAHAVLARPMPRDLVHKLNGLPFSESGTERRICVEDAHGSPEQKCPKWIAKYCRGQNLRFTHPCWCWHPKRETDDATYQLESIELEGAKGNEIISKFMRSAPFHDGSTPTVVAIKAIKNPVLSRLHEEYRRYLATKHREEPSVRELYHGTNNKIHDVLFTHGLQPPSDCQASDACPVSGGKGLGTTLCNNNCKHCTEKHKWNRCHMFGLGIYLADMAQKSHRYVSQTGRSSSGVQECKMIVCSVLGKAFKVEGHLQCKDAMHDVVNVRALTEDELEQMIEPCAAECGAKRDAAADAPAEKSDLIFVQGLGGNVRHGYSVVNSEYIAFHPHQCLPKYEITYELP